jgi:NADH dehydrogenase FAD-containing subunit
MEMAPEVMTTVDLDLGALVAAELRRQGVEVVTQQAISSVVQDGKALVLEDMLTEQQMKRPRSEAKLVAMRSCQLGKCVWPCSHW